MQRLQSHVKRYLTGQSQHAERQLYTLTWMWARSSSYIRPTKPPALVSAGAVAPVAVAVPRGGFIGGDALREKSATASLQHAQRPAQPARSSGYRLQGNL
eukprot:COSAG05_NODE_333_length_11249_cov_629.633094_1_plen_100_part_00